MRIEAARYAIESLPLNLKLIVALRETARLRSTHFSTRIEGNRLTQVEVGAALDGVVFPGRERDVDEVRNYYRALEAMEQRAEQGLPLTETDLRRLHGLTFYGVDRPTPYREAQNVIRDSASGRMIYLPPEAQDVPALMAQLVTWVNLNIEAQHLPMPVIAALAHYQFATIHPYFDGNGRTARLLASLMLHLTGYGLKGLYSLEAYYAENLHGYYAALSVGASHNYYMGRAEADVTAFITYFCVGMADAFGRVEAQARESAAPGTMDQSAALRKLDPRQRRVLELFRQSGVVTTAELAKQLGLKRETTVKLCRQWLVNGFLELQDASRKNRAYRLGRGFEGF